MLAEGLKLTEAEAERILLALPPAEHVRTIAVERWGHAETAKKYLNVYEQATQPCLMRCDGRRAGYTVSDSALARLRCGLLMQFGHRQVADTTNDVTMTRFRAGQLVSPAPVRDRNDRRFQPVEAGRGRQPSNRALISDPVRRVTGVAVPR